jgi:hypothetical protein
MTYAGQPRWSRALGWLVVVVGVLVVVVVVVGTLQYVRNENQRPINECVKSVGVDNAAGCAP